jgi:hypothetical protein
MADASLANATINPLSQSVQLMKDFGFFEVVLPLILVFAVFYGILIVTGIFGPADDKTKPLYSVISFVAAFLVIASTSVVKMINEIIPTASLFLVLIILVLMMMGMFGITPSKKDYFKETSWPARIVAVIIIIIFLGIIDASFENVEVPLIHSISESFVESDDDSSSMPSLPSMGDSDGLTQEQINQIINLAVVAILMLALPIITIYFITHAGEGKNP